MLAGPASGAGGAHLGRPLDPGRDALHGLAVRGLHAHLHLCPARPRAACLRQRLFAPCLPEITRRRPRLICTTPWCGTRPRMYYSRQHRASRAQGCMRLGLCCEHTGWYPKDLKLAGDAPVRNDRRAVRAVRQEQAPHAKVVLHRPVLRPGLPGVELAQQRQRLGPPGLGLGVGQHVRATLLLAGVGAWHSRSPHDDRLRAATHSLHPPLRHACRPAWPRACRARTGAAPARPAPTPGTRCPAAPRARRGSGRSTCTLAAPSSVAGAGTRRRALTAHT